MATLTEHLVMARNRVGSLVAVKNLNLWGQNLKDISLVSQMANVEVVSLSVNSIESLEPFASCHILKELYLRKNNIGDLTEVQHLRKLPSLTTLWLSDNPCAEDPVYRKYIIRTLRGLKKLDNTAITAQEREAAMQAEAPIPSPPRRRVVRAPIEPEVDEREMLKEIDGPMGAMRDVQPAEEGWSRPTHPPAELPRRRARKDGNNIFFAVLSLLKELDDDALELVRSEIDELLRSH